MKAYIEAMGILSPKTIYRNLSPAQLTEHALERGEGKLSKTGALVINTGKYTGRSPDDRFIVDTPNVHDIVDWGKVNVPISRERADAIYDKMCAYMQNREVFVVDGYVAPTTSMLCQFAWYARMRQAHCLQPKHSYAPIRNSSRTSNPSSPYSAPPASSVSRNATA